MSDGVCNGWFVNVGAGFELEGMGTGTVSTILISGFPRWFLCRQSVGIESWVRGSPEIAKWVCLGWRHYMTVPCCI